jgi:cyclophilin family peptidyl-prolyl cis-trans isomerase/protein-disulfide isomerase
MKRSLPLILLALVLAACGKATPTASVTPTPVPSPTPLPCSAALVGLTPTPIPGEGSLFPPVAPNEWIRGPADAPVTIVSYNDFQCVECNEKMLLDVYNAHPNDVRLVYRHFPQPELFDKSLLAAQAAEAAGAQGKFWEMHDLLFARQNDWVSLAPDDFKTWVASEAETLGLSRAQFEADLESAAAVIKIQKAVEDGKAAGIPVIPLVLLNGQIYSASKDFYSLDQVVRLMSLSRKQFDTCPQMGIDPRKQYFAAIQTEKGDIVIELYADKTPLTVNAFIFLARHGWYDGVTFHRVIPDFVAQAGDPSGTGLGGPGFVFRNEIEPSLHFDKPGMVGMANSGPDTNGSQFFITFTPQPGLDGFYTIFGHVLSGMDVLARLTPRDPSLNAVIPDGDLIITIAIEER